jgi:predicted dinucleotide-binding enzyme
MKVAIIGMGNVGGNLGRLWTAKGHTITFGVREPEAPKVEALLQKTGPSASAVTVEEAVKGADAILLAVPWTAAEDVVRSLGDLGGAVLIDATNPVAPGLELDVGHTTSGAECIAGWAERGRVVKAFNTLGAEHLSNPRIGDQKLSVFVCGDDAEAKSVVVALAEELGFEAVNAGPLANARLLEPMAMLWIRLAITEGLGRDIAIKLLRK